MTRWTFDVQLRFKVAVDACVARVALRNVNLVAILRCADKQRALFG